MRSSSDIAYTYSTKTPKGDRVLLLRIPNGILVDIINPHIEMRIPGNNPVEAYFRTRLRRDRGWGSSEYEPGSIRFWDTLSSYDFRQECDLYVRSHLG